MKPLFLACRRPLSHCILKWPLFFVHAERGSERVREREGESERARGRLSTHEQEPRCLFLLLEGHQSCGVRTSPCDLTYP